MNADADFLDQVERHLNDEIEVAEFLTQVGDPDRRRSLREQWLIHHLLTQAGQGQADLWPGVRTRLAAVGTTGRFQQAVMKRLRQRQRAQSRRRLFLAVAAALLLAIGGAAVFWPRPSLKVRSAVGSQVARLAAGERLQVPAGAMVSLDLGNGRGVLDCLGPTDLTLVQTTPTCVVHLNAGELIATIVPRPGPPALIVTTGQGTATVTGTQLRLEVRKNQACLEVAEGSVAFSNHHGDWSVTAHQALLVDEDGSGQLVSTKPIPHERGSVTAQDWVLDPAQWRPGPVLKQLMRSPPVLIDPGVKASHPSSEVVLLKNDPHAAENRRRYLWALPPLPGAFMVEMTVRMDEQSAISLFTDGAFDLRREVMAFRLPLNKAIVMQEWFLAVGRDQRGYPVYEVLTVMDGRINTRRLVLARPHAWGMALQRQQQSGTIQISAPVIYAMEGAL